MWTALVSPSKNRKIKIAIEREKSTARQPPSLENTTVAQKYNSSAEIREACIILAHKRLLKRVAITQVAACVLLCPQ